MSFWEPDALPMALNVISVLTCQGGSGAGTYAVHTRTLPIQTLTLAQHRLCPHQPGFQELPSLAVSSSHMQRELRALILHHSLVPADSGCSGYLK